jgi:putative tryptophan/tyrosine transport system substrate-binding protein
MDRRMFIRAVAGGIFAAPLSSVAQSSAKTVRIGRLSPLSAEADVPLLAAFRRGMRDLGWIEGDQFFIETRYADGNPIGSPNSLWSLSGRVWTFFSPDQTRVL